MAPVAELSRAYPLASALDGRGRLQVGGCDVLEVAAEFGTPAWLVAEDDLRARARAYRDALHARHGEDGLVVYASKAFPCTAVLRVFAEEGLGCDVASGGELHLALRAGFPADRLVVHGNAKSDRELREAVAAEAGLVVVDALDELARLEAVARDAGRVQPVLVRVNPGVEADTHAAILTGTARSKFGLGHRDARRAIDRAGASEHLDLRGLHVHVGSQLTSLEFLHTTVAALAALGDHAVYDLGGGLGTAYLAEDRLPSIDDDVAARVDAVHELLGPDKRILLEPGRALVANAAVTAYRVETVKRTASDTWVGVDGGMSDNLRPMLYGAPFEAAVADRFAGDGEHVHLAGKHCESGDVLVRDVVLVDPRPGDVVVMPATGAYTFAMANNYNGVPRPPVVFCRDGDARLVVRRETYEDLTARDVEPGAPA